MHGMLLRENGDFTQTLAAGILAGRSTKGSSEEIGMTRPASGTILFATSLIFALSSTALAGNWPQWRGPYGDGVSTETKLPLEWSERSHVIWKCPLPEHGASTPAIWSDAVFLTSQQGEKLLVFKINKATGRIEWTQEVGTGSVARMSMRAKRDPGSRREQKFHDYHNMASPSPVTDGERVIVHFGNGDLAAYDFTGRKLWSHNLQKEHGTYTIWWGHANSPVLYQDLVISVCMQDSLADFEKPPMTSYLVAHDKRTGQQKWKTLRMTQAQAEQCDSYTTPLLYRAGDGVQLIVMGGNQIDAYDPATGRQLWALPGIVGGRTITGPTLARDLVYATQGQRGPLLAIKLGGSGQLDTSAIVWKETQGTSDSCCPVVWKDWIFWVTDNGVAQCHDARTGELKWKERLATGNYKASPLAADGRIYFLNLAGLCTVVSAGPKFEKLAENKLEDETIASPAVSDGRIYLRGKKALYCIAAASE
jgi:outer membrane protein assembly factor BamB